MSGTWNTVTINDRPADIFEPESPSAGRAVIFLHGHGLTSLRDNPDWTAELDRHGLRTVCPQGGRSWWLPVGCDDFDRALTSFDYVREHVAAWSQQHWQAAVPSIALTGVSMGGQGALQLAYRHGRDFPVVAAVSPVVDFHDWYGRGLPLDDMFENAEAARQQTAILHLHPLNWPREQLLTCDPSDRDCLPGVERLASKLSSSGIPFQLDVETSGGGHSWDYFNRVAPRVIHFLAEALERESLRVI